MQSRQYIYTKISELKEGDRDVNVYGIVKFHRAPIQTATNDWNGVYTLIDRSVEDNVESGIRCNLFSSSKEKLPSVSKIGDIVRFHRMFIQTFRGRLQMRGSKSYSSWLVLTKQDGYVTPSSSHDNYTLTDVDRQHIEELKVFSNRIMHKLLTNNVTLLKDVSLERYVDLVVRVVQKFTFRDEPDFCLLRVTDGTDFPFNSFRPTGCIKKDNQMNGKYTCDICLYHNHAKDLFSYNEGDFIELRNLHVRPVSADLLEKTKDKVTLIENSAKVHWAEMALHFGGESYNRGISAADNGNKYVIDIKRRLEVLQQQRQQILSETNLVCTNSMPITTIQKREYFAETRNSPLTPCVIADILNDTCSDIKRYKIQGKLLAIKPKNLEEFVVHFCEKCYRVNKNIDRHCTTLAQCQYCREPSTRQTYFIEILVEDISGTITVQFFDKHASVFLNDLTPSQFLCAVERKSATTVQKLEMAVKKLEYVQDVLDISCLPSIELGVIAFPSDNNEDMIYRGFGTVMTS